MFFENSGARILFKMAEFESRIAEAEIEEIRRSRMVLPVTGNYLNGVSLYERFSIDDNEIDDARTMEKGKSCEDIAREMILDVVGLRSLDVITGTIIVEGETVNIRKILNYSGIGFIDGEVIDLTGKHGYKAEKHIVIARNLCVYEFNHPYDFIISTKEEDQAPK